MMNNESRHLKNGSEDLTQFLSKLKMLDEKNMKQVKRWKWIFGTLAILFIFFLVVKPDLKMLIDLIAILLLFVVTSVYIKWSDQKNLSLSVKEQLIDSAKKYRFITPVFILFALLAIPLIYVGIDTLMRQYILVNTPSDQIFRIVALVFLVFYSTVLVFAYLTWRKKSKPVLDEIHLFLRDLEQE